MNINLQLIGRNILNKTPSLVEFEKVASELNDYINISNGSLISSNGIKTTNDSVVVKTAASTPNLRGWVCHKRSKSTAKQPLSSSKSETVISTLPKHEKTKTELALSTPAPEIRTVDSIGLRRERKLDRVSESEVQSSNDESIIKIPLFNEKTMSSKSSLMSPRSSLLSPRSPRSPVISQRGIPRTSESVASPRAIRIYESPIGRSTSVKPKTEARKINEDLLKLTAQNFQGYSTGKHLLVFGPDRLLYQLPQKDLTTHNKALKHLLEGEYNAYILYKDIKKLVFAIDYNYDFKGLSIHIFGPNGVYILKSSHIEKDNVTSFTSMFKIKKLLNNFKLPITELDLPLIVSRKIEPVDDRQNGMKSKSTRPPDTRKNPKKINKKF
jgi:hypothetical protein